MDVIDGNWIMRGIGWDDPKCIHSADELAAVVNEIGFLPLFSNEIEGFSVEEMTSSEHWWSGETSFDKIAKCVKKHFGNTEDKDIKKVVK